MASLTSTPVTSTSRPSRTTRRATVSGTAAVSPSGISPTRLTRIQEKEELGQLNDRLAAYIERVRQLENEKSSMRILLEEKEQSSTRELGKIRLLYENELADARKSLDTTANEKARLQIELGQLSEDHRQLQTRNSKKESELATALGRWRNLEAVLNSKEAEFANLLAGNRGLENEITDLNAHVSNLELALQDAKTQLHAEMLRRVDMENQVQTLREQLEFQRHISEQEVREMRSRHETRLVEVESGRQQDFESKLAEALQQLRQEQEAQIQQYKEELEKTYRAKLENAQHSATKNSDLASSTREELAGTKMRVESLSSQLSHFQKQNSVLETTVRELEAMLAREREAGQRRLVEKEREMVDMRQQMQAQLEDYENLLDVKLALDMEINTYRKMLEGEEERLNLSPSPSQHGPVSRTHAHTQAARRQRGKKRKLEGRASVSPGYKISQHSSAQGSVSIDEIDLEGNYMKLRNNSETDQPLSGWVLRKSHRTTPEVSFQIPPSYVLRAGQTLTIWGAGAGVDPKPPTDLVLKTQRTWGLVDDVRVVLVNPHNEETAERRLVRVERGVEGDSDVELEEEDVGGRDAHLRRQGRTAEDASCAVM